MGQGQVLKGRIRSLQPVHVSAGNPTAGLEEAQPERGKVEKDSHVSSLYCRVFASGLCRLATPYAELVARTRFPTLRLTQQQDDFHRITRPPHVTRDLSHFSSIPYPTGTLQLGSSNETTFVEQLTSTARCPRFSSWPSRCSPERCPSPASPAQNSLAPCPCLDRACA